MMADDPLLEGWFPEKKSRLKNLIHRMPDEALPGILLLSAFLDESKWSDGPGRHKLIMEWVRSGCTRDEDLRQFLEDRFLTGSGFMKSWDRARKKEDRGRGGKTWVAVWSGCGPPGAGDSQCPQLLFGRGSIEGWKPWVAIFNSRKPRISTGKEEWLEALRRILPVLASNGFGFATSCGTVTYDLVTAFARRTGAPVLLAASSGLESAEGLSAGDDSPGCCAPVILSCMMADWRCRKAVRMLCRDRLLAFLADVHCVLEIREGGNLYAIIEAQQEEDPKPQMIIRPWRQARGKSANERFLERFPEHAKRWDLIEPAGETAPVERAGPCAAEVREPGEVAWGEYLYHYTRGWHGPWPGQTYREYLLELLDGGPSCAHNVLDTLVRILTEGVLRASSRLVRGENAVVSWTSRPPLELGSIRLWNRGLIRWTFEPYGLAIRRKVLKEHGARPTVYGAGVSHERLKPADRYRFQKHEPPRCSWKHEREWRLGKDLELKSIGPGDWFVFIPDRGVCEALQRRFAGMLSVVFLSETGACAT